VIRKPRSTALKVQNKLPFCSAQGERESNILRAEGEKQAQALRAEGFAVALEAIYNAAKTVDQKTMTLQYFETLKSIGTVPPPSTSSRWNSPACWITSWAKKARSNSNL
jgi:hypothetical protein